MKITNKGHNVKTRTVLFILTAALSLSMVVPAESGRGRFLSLCQELVNQARSYESRATHHANEARNLMVRIEQMGSREKSAQTAADLDRLFKDYDEHRAMEKKLRELFRSLSQEADKCMKDSN